MANIDREIKSRFVSEQQRFVANIVFTANWIQNMMNDQLKPFDISSQQYNILRILTGAGDWVAMSEVKSRMVEKSPNATRLADKLVKKKLIERNRSETDRRVVYIRVTEAGKELLEEIDQLPNPITDAMQNHISAEEARQASAVIDKFRG